MTLQANKLMKSLCEAWEAGISFSEVSDFLGVSRPTFYKILNNLRDDGLEFFLLPNLQRLGLSLIIVTTQSLRGSETPSDHMIELRTMQKAILLYVNSRHVKYVSEALRLFGMKVSEPYSVEKLVCPDGRVLEPDASSGPIRETIDWQVISEVSESFPGIKEVAKKYGRPWQYVMWYLKRARSKGILVGPVFYNRTGSGDMANVALRLDLGYPEEIIDELKGYSSVVVFRSEALTSLIVTVVPFRALYSVLDRYGGYVKNIYVSRSYPIKPLKHPYVVMDGVKDSVVLLEPLIRIFSGRQSGIQSS